MIKAAPQWKGSTAKEGLVKPRGALPWCKCYETTPVHMGGPTHKLYLLMLPKHTQPHAEGVPNKHSCPMYTYAQLWARVYSSPCGRGTQHTLSPNTGVVSTPTPLPSVWDTYHTYLHVSHRVAQASTIPHGRGNEPNACHYLHLYGT